MFKERLIEWYEENIHRYPPLVLAAVIHNQFENIHPFSDGNDRVGRLLLNNILLKHELPHVNIEFKHREAYYLALQKYEDEGNIKPTLELLLKEYRVLLQNLNLWLQTCFLESHRTLQHKRKYVTTFSRTCSHRVDVNTTMLTISS